MRLTILWMVCVLLRIRGQEQGQDLLLSELTRSQDELNTRRLASATSYLTKSYIASRINTLVIRQSCLACPSKLHHRQQRVVDHKT